MCVRGGRGEGGEGGTGGGRATARGPLAKLVARWRGSEGGGERALDRDVAGGGGGAHLHEPVAPERGGLRERREPVELVVEPVLLVHGEPPVLGRGHEVVPEALVVRQRVPRRPVDQEVPLAAVLLRVVGVGGPVAVVPLHEPRGLLVHVAHPVREDGGHRRPVVHAVVQPLVVPPRVRQPVLVRQAGLRRVLGDGDHRLLVVAPVGRVVVVVRAVVRRVAELLQREVLLPRCLARLAVAAQQHIAPREHSVGHPSPHDDRHLRRVARGHLRGTTTRRHERWRGRRRGRRRRRRWAVGRAAADARTRAIARARAQVGHT